jgi:hypothetical protein
MLCYALWEIQMLMFSIDAIHLSIRKFHSPLGGWNFRWNSQPIPTTFSSRKFRTCPYLFLQNIKLSACTTYNIFVNIEDIPCSVLVFLSYHFFCLLIKMMMCLQGIKMWCNDVWMWIEDRIYVFHTFMFSCTVKYLNFGEKWVLKSFKWVVLYIMKWRVFFKTITFILCSFLFSSYMFSRMICYFLL